MKTPIMAVFNTGSKMIFKIQFAAQKAFRPIANNQD